MTSRGVAPDPDPYGYQRIQASDGSRSAGRDRSPTAQRILPADLSGRSILDIGCGYGYFCLEAARRGAARVLGIDVSAENILTARRLAAASNLCVEFRRGDIESEGLDESFDYVICLNVLHFLRNPPAVLERIASLTRERLLLEVAGFGANDRRNLKLSRWRAALLGRCPVAYIARPGKSGRRRAQRWYFSTSALQNLLVHQGLGFARVEVLPSVHKGRNILVASKRRIGHLVLVAGPAGSGQASVVDRLLSGRASDLADRIGIEDPSSWTWCSALQVDRIASVVDRLVVHCDLPGLSLDFGHDVTALARCANRLTLVTVSAPLEVLRERFAALRVSLPTRRGWWSEGRRYRRIQRALGDPTRLADRIRAWSEPLRSGCGAREISLSFDDEIRISSEHGPPATCETGAPPRG